MSETLKAFIFGFRNAFNPIKIKHAKEYGEIANNIRIKRIEALGERYGITKSTTKK
ncbi:hypothetical protein [Campylobacter pinnipediorum]|uniref:hypothetical protein n=1 Tax=Campylobacter pinnipediorum TaxID=1965231 RepID=UPI0009C2E84F|nr:hypothetical protein [Campylobacter pinnipediorum]AQW83016.1 hypothetical protein CPIN17261_1012 [Campylobacter pinnipediorum subsp. pinnipediorum]